MAALTIRSGQSVNVDTVLSAHDWHNPHGMVETATTYQETYPSGLSLSAARSAPGGPFTSMTVSDAGGNPVLEITGAAYHDTPLPEDTFPGFLTVVLDGHDRIEGGAGGDLLRGFAGNDTFIPNGGDDIIYGGDGTAKVVLAGNRADYTVREEGSYVSITDSVAGRDGADRTHQVTQFEFDDGTVALHDLIAPTDVDNGIYRFYNTATGTHFYTSSAEERDAVIDTIDSYNYEGTAFAMATGEGAVPVFRFYNHNTNAHFYTADEAEAAQVATYDGFEVNGPSYYAYAEAGEGRSAVHRFLNKETGTHFYTASEGEKAMVMETLGHVYQYEHVAYYV